MPRAVNATAIPFQACPAYLGRWRCSVQEKIVLTALGQGFEEGACEFPEGGSFLEMGGNNGLHESNTRCLEAYFGWSGYLIEANPQLYRDLCRNRPKAVGMSLAVCPRAGTVNLTIPVRHKDRYGRKNGTFAAAPAAGIAEYFGRAHNATFRVDDAAVTRQVPCLPLHSIILGNQGLDYLSVDVEGAELMALQTFPWERIKPRVVGVEQSADSQPKNAAVRGLLRENGYALVGTAVTW